MIHLLLSHPRFFFIVLPMLIVASGFLGALIEAWNRNDKREDGK